MIPRLYFVAPLLALVLPCILTCPAHAFSTNNELAVIGMPPGTGLPPSIGLDACMVYGSLGAGATLMVASEAMVPFWSTWASYAVTKPVSVFVGAATLFSTSQCTGTPGVPCSSGLAAGQVGAIVGVSLRSNLGQFWLDFNPSLMVRAGGDFNPGYGILNSFVAGPPFIELGYRATDRISVSLRSSLIPLKLAMAF